MKGSLRSIIRIVFPDLHFISLLKWELKLLFVHLYSRLSPLERIKLHELKKRQALKLNVGNGPFRHKEWINIDCRLSSNRDSLAFDLRRRWPLASGSVKFIFSEHVFEHFNYPDDIQHILSECNRLLQKQGVLRVIVPDAERYLKAYCDLDVEFLRSARSDAEFRMEAVNRVFRENGFHKYAYDYETMKHLLERAGFSEVRRSEFRSSPHDELNVDLDEPQRRLESLYVEAVR